MAQDKTFNGPDGSFHYVDWGTRGPLVHLSHATGFCARAYGPLAERLTPRFRVVGLDDRGHGRTTAPADPRKLRDWQVFADDLERFFDYLAEPVVAVGHSRGGVASLMLSAKRPDLIRALILLDPTILPPSWTWWSYLIKKFGLAGFLPIAAKAAQRRNGWPNRAAVLEAYQGKGPFQGWTDGFLEGYLTDGLTVAKDGRVRLACSPAWESRCFTTFSHNAWAYVRRLTVPTLVIYGQESDTFTQPAVRSFQHLVPPAVFIGLPETSHFVPMERPDQTTTAILNFLESLKILS